MKKIENLEQYTEVENKITELLSFVNDATPVTDPYYLQLETCAELIFEYDRIHFKVKGVRMSWKLSQTRTSRFERL